MKTYLKEKQVAEMTGLSLPKLRQDRIKRQGIVFVKFGVNVRYDMDDVVNFMEQHKAWDGQKPNQQHLLKCSCGGVFLSTFGSSSPLTEVRCSKCGMVGI